VPLRITYADSAATVATLATLGLDTTSAEAATVAQRPSVRWNEDIALDGVGSISLGSRCKVERMDRAEAERDLGELPAQRPEDARRCRSDASTPWS
jgi:hypothetical protein